MDDIWYLAITFRNISLHLFTFTIYIVKKTSQICRNMGVVCLLELMQILWSFAICCLPQKLNKNGWFILLFLQGMLVEGPPGPEGPIVSGPLNSS